MPPLPLLAEHIYDFPQLLFYKFIPKHSPYIKQEDRIWVLYWYNLQQNKLIWEFCFINCFRCHLSFSLNFYIHMAMTSCSIRKMNIIRKHASTILQLIVAATCSGLQCNNKNKNKKWFASHLEITCQGNIEKIKSEENSLKTV